MGHALLHRLHLSPQKVWIKPFIKFSTSDIAFQLYDNLVWKLIASSVAKLKKIWREFNENAGGEIWNCGVIANSSCLVGTISYPTRAQGIIDDKLEIEVPLVVPNANDVLWLWKKHGISISFPFWLWKERGNFHVPFRSVCERNMACKRNNEFFMFLFVLSMKGKWKLHVPLRSACERDMTFPCSFAFCLWKKQGNFHVPLHCAGETNMEIPMFLCALPCCSTCEMNMENSMFLYNVLHVERNIEIFTFVFVLLMEGTWKLPCFFLFFPLKGYGNFHLLYRKNERNMEIIPALLWKKRTFLSFANFNWKEQLQLCAFLQDENVEISTSLTAFVSVVALVNWVDHTNIYVICQLWGPCSDKLWPRSWKCCPMPQAEGSFFKTEDTYFWM